jgi:hypothetical protein
MKWRVETICSSGESRGTRSQTLTRLARLVVDITRPVGLPPASRSTKPPNSFGISLSQPSTLIAERFSQARS